MLDIKQFSLLPHTPTIHKHNKVKDNYSNSSVDKYVFIVKFELLFPFVLANVAH